MISVEGRARGIVVAAPTSGSGKTLVSIGLIGALKRAGYAVGVAKTGPDYIDTAFLSSVGGRAALNLDPWAMSADALRGLASAAAEGCDLLLVEGVMGLFDGAAGGGGTTADLARTLGLPVVLVVDARHQAQSVAALVHGFKNFRSDVDLAGVIFNSVASERHEEILKEALAETGVACLGALRRDAALGVPSRHLGLTLPDETAHLADLMAHAAQAIGEGVDLEALVAASRPLLEAAMACDLPPLGRHVAIARDDAFGFCYAHWLDGWVRQGDVRLSFFSPLADEAPDLAADAIFLPGGYPELHGAQLAAATQFKAGLVAAAAREVLIYGECGGYMVLGETLTDREGVCHRMGGLLPLHSRIDPPRRVLGYRQLEHHGALPWPKHLRGHEFHYSSANDPGLPPLFVSEDARGRVHGQIGAVRGRVMGSYAHVISAGPAA